MKSNIRIYSTKTCPYCVKAKSFLSREGFTFEEVDLTDRPDEIEKIKARTGHRTVPLIFVDEKFVGGYTDMMSQIQSGDLVLQR